MAGEIFVRDAADAVLESRQSKIDQKSKGKVHQPQISEKLLGVHGGVRLRGFEFYEQAAFYENVGSKGVRYQNATMLDWDRQLALKAHAASLQFRAEQKLVRRFQKTGAKGPVKLITAIDNDPSQLLEAIGIKISWLCGFVRKFFDHP